jgi:signal transduction histidine kinase
VSNLVVNASEAVEPKGGSVNVRIGSDFFNRSGLAGGEFSEDLPEGPYVFLEVQDNGMGISDEVRARIFEPFFSTKFTGRGLGLAAVLGIVRGHKGTIQVASVLGRSSTFRVLLPACVRDAPTPYS